jgi:hypothetical protein
MEKNKTSPNAHNATTAIIKISAFFILFLRRHAAPNALSVLFLIIAPKTKIFKPHFAAVCKNFVCFCPFTHQTPHLSAPLLSVTPCKKQKKPVK